MTWRLTNKLGISCPALKQSFQALWLRVLPWNTPFVVSSCSQQKRLLLTCGNMQWELFSCWLSCLGQPWDWKVLTWDRNVAHSPCLPPDCRRGHASLQAAQSSDMNVPWARCQGYICCILRWINLPWATSSCSRAGRRKGFVMKEEAGTALSSVMRKPVGPPYPNLQLG